MSASKPTPKISINGFVNNLYKRYIEASRKEEQRRKIEEVIERIDVTGEWNSIWSTRKGCWEYFTMLPEELEARIKEIWEYAFPDNVFISAGVHVTTCQVVGREYSNEIVGRFTVIDADGYINYVKITEVDGVSIYIVVNDKEVD